MACPASGPAVRYSLPAGACGRRQRNSREREQERAKGIRRRGLWENTKRELKERGKKRGKGHRRRRCPAMYPANPHPDPNGIVWTRRALTPHHPQPVPSVRDHEPSSQEQELSSTASEPLPSRRLPAQQQASEQPHRTPPVSTLKSSQVSAPRPKTAAPGDGPIRHAPFLPQEATHLTTSVKPS